MINTVAGIVDAGGRVIWENSRDSGNLAEAQNRQDGSWVSVIETEHAF